MPMSPSSRPIHRCARTKKTSRSTASSTAASTSSCNSSGRFFARTHRFFDRVLDSPFLIRTLARFGSSTNARDLGPLTVSILAGEEGNQQKELTRLVAWLQRDFKPDLIQLTNAMFVGMARQLKAQLGVPVLCALQGEDLFLDGLPEPSKTQALNILRQRAQGIDAFIAPCEYYQDYMAEYLQVPRTKIHVVPLGLNLTGHGQEPPPPADGPYKIGYLARICPEKGFHLLVDAIPQVKKSSLSLPPCASKPPATSVHTTSPTSPSRCKKSAAGG